MRTRATDRRSVMAWWRLTAAVGAVLALTAPLSARASERSDSAERGAEYLVEHQAADGTFFGDTAPHRVAEALVALVAGGIDDDPVERALSVIEAGGSEAADTAGEAGLLVMGIVAGGGDPHDFHGEDYAAHLRSFYEKTVPGVYDTQMFQNALALLGVVAAGETIPDRAITYLRLNRCADGGISIQPSCGAGSGHVDVTALVLNALARAGMPPSDSLRSGARGFLVAAQNGEGGFGDTKGKPTNANSTGLVLTAIAALGESATEAPWRQPDGDDPVERLLALQQEDGRFRLSTAAEGDPFIATRQAVPGIAGRALPVGPNGSSPGPPPGNPPGGDPIPSGVPGVESLPTVSASATPTIGASISPPASITGVAGPDASASLIAVGATSKADDGDRPIMPLLGAAIALVAVVGSLVARIRSVAVRTSSSAPATNGARAGRSPSWIRSLRSYFRTGARGG